MNKINYFAMLCLIVLRIQVLVAQTTNTNNVRPSTPAFNGWDSSGNSGSLEIRNDFNDVIEFWTNGNPYLRLTNIGNLDLIDAYKGYQIGTYTVLRYQNANFTNIMVGVDAGSTSNATENTYVGYGAGLNTGSTSGAPDFDASHNTFVGHMAGNQNTIGRQNVFIGDSAGYENTYGYHNAFTGVKAGWKNTIGISNTYMGYESGMSTVSNNFNTMVGRATGKFSIGDHNCFYGKDVAQSLNGSDNCYFGSHAGYDSFDFLGTIDSNTVCGSGAARNYIGSGNCYYGFISANGPGGFPSIKGDCNSFYGTRTNFGTGISQLNFAGAFGYGARPNSDYKIIIGANTINNIPVNVGIGLSDDIFFGGPRSPLEINGNSTTTNTINSGESGLQFRQLTQASSPSTWEPSWGGVLTVNTVGVVKLTENTGFGRCNSGIPTLTDDIGMFLDGHKITFEGNSKSIQDNDMLSSIGLGYSCFSQLPGKLSVYQSASDNEVSTTAGFFQNEDQDFPESFAVVKKGIWAISDGYSEGINIGGDFFADSSTVKNVAVNGFAGNPTQDIAEYQNTGGSFAADYAGVNIGVEAYVYGNGFINYGIIASAPIGTCNNLWCNDAAGLFYGDIWHSAGFWGPSDINLKNNIHPLINSLDIITALEPKEFEYRNNQFPYLNLPTGIQHGLIAQEVESILPSVVKEFAVTPLRNIDGSSDTTHMGEHFKAVDYTALIPYLISAVKEEFDTIDSLKNQLVDLQNQLNNCCTSTGHLRKSSSIELSDITTIVLNQNLPNPFSEETYITFSIPESVSKALIVIFDKTGNVLKKVTIEERGEGSLHVYAANLSSGIYTYSLVADGETIDSKKMVCHK